ncbi:hypothetical protein C819_03018 [Lachnospiraceae bacterium 10-1]|nr:hypothetical protein C819_03018 [Lachnospiraceae bacterium 10-1]
MEFRDLKNQYLKNKTAIDSAIQNVLLSSHFIGGEPVSQLEEKLADYVGVKHCITCANGTDALQLALMAWEIGEGDAVFVPDFTFFSTGEVVPWVQATPVFVDVDKDTFNLSPESLEEAIQNVIREGKLVPKVVIAVDLFGQPADYPEIRKITQKYNLLLLEDGAQGFGGRIGEKKACSFGDISTTSFFPAKPLGCYGDGGAVFTDNDEWAELIRSYKVHGKGMDKYDNVRIGLNSRLDTLQAAVLLAKFDCFVNEEIDAVNSVAKKYSECLVNFVDVPIIKEGFLSSWAQYTIKVKDKENRDKIQIFFNENGIPSMVYYSKPLHFQKAFKESTNQYVSLNNTVELCNKVLSLPMHPYMQKAEVYKIIKAIKNYYV